MGLFTQSGQLRYQPRYAISPEQAEHELDRFEKLTELLFTQRPVSLKLDLVDVKWDDYVQLYQTTVTWLNGSLRSEGTVEVVTLDQIEYLRSFAADHLNQVRSHIEILAHELWDYERKLSGRREREITTLIPKRGPEGYADYLALHIDGDNPLSFAEWSALNYGPPIGQRKHLEGK